MRSTSSSKTLRCTVENGKIQYRRSFGRHRVLDLARGERAVPLDDDAVDVELGAFLDPEHHPQVALGRPLGARGDWTPKYPSSSYFWRMASSAFWTSTGLYSTPTRMAAFSRSSSLLSSGLPSKLTSRRSGRSTTAKITRTPPSNSSVRTWTSSKNPSPKMERTSSRSAAGESGSPILVCTRFRMAGAWIRRFPSTRMSRTVGMGGGGWVGAGCWAQPAGGQREESDQRREKDPAPSPGAFLAGISRREPRALLGRARTGRSALRQAQCGLGIGSKMNSSPWTRTSIWIPSWIRPAMMDSASGSSMCFWMMRRSCRAP